MLNDKTSARICPFSFAFALGITNAIGMVLLAFLAKQFDYGTAMVTVIASVYHGYAASFMGAVYGGLWGLVEGFVFGLILVFI